MMLGAIGLTTSQLVGVAWPEVAPARSRRHARCGTGSGECEGKAMQQAAVGARVRSREELGSLGRRRERAEAEGVLACGDDNGRRQMAGAHAGAATARYL
jgi:hypothetical protein